MSDLIALLAGVGADPDDEFARSVLADWFDEHRDPRGRLIRLELGLIRDGRSWEEREHLIATDEELSQLREECEQLWEDDLPPTSGPVALPLHEGVPLAAECSIPTFLEGGEAIMTRLPCVVGLRNVERLGLQSLREREERLGRLLTSDLASTLHLLDLTGDNMGNLGVRLLARSRKLSGLRRLSLSGNQIDSAGVQRLTESGALPSLTRLSLSHNVISEGGAEVLADSDLLSGLELLHLDFNHLRDRGVSALADSISTKNLVGLSLRHTDLGAAGVRALAEAEAFDNLLLLDIGANAVSARALRRLIESAHLPSLRTLVVSPQHVGERSRREFEKEAPFRIAWR